MRSGFGFQGFGFNTPAGIRAVSAPTPLAIFGNRCRVWFDNQDLTTMFQDSAATIPAAVNQPVGYQRCKANPAFFRSQATAANRPTLRLSAGGVYYLECDATNDGLVTPSIDFSNTDKVSVFQGIRTLATTTQVFTELSTDGGSNVGTFYMLAVTGNYRGMSRGTTLRTVNSAVIGAPDTAVLTLLGDISAPAVTLRRNGVQVAQGLASQGTGNFGNFPLYYFRRGGTTNPLNGWEFGSVIVDAVATADQIAAMENIYLGLAGRL